MHASKCRACQQICVKYQKYPTTIVSDICASVHAHNTSSLIITIIAESSLLASLPKSTTYIRATNSMKQYKFGYVQTISDHIIPEPLGSPQTLNVFYPICNWVVRAHAHRIRVYMHGRLAIVLQVDPVSVSTSIDPVVRLRRRRRKYPH